MAASASQNPNDEEKAISSPAINVTIFDDAFIDKITIAKDQVDVVNSKGERFIIAPHCLDRFLATHVGAFRLRLTIANNALSKLSVKGASFVHFFDRVSTLILEGSSDVKYIQFMLNCAFNIKYIVAFSMTLHQHTGEFKSLIIPSNVVELHFDFNRSGDVSLMSNVTGIYDIPNNLHRYSTLFFGSNDFVVTHDFQRLINILCGLTVPGAHVILKCNVPIHRSLLAEMTSRYSFHQLQTFSDNSSRVQEIKEKGYDRYQCIYDDRKFTFLFSIKPSAW